MHRSDPALALAYSLNAGLIPLFGQLEINLACVRDTPRCIQYFQRDEVSIVVVIQNNSGLILVALDDFHIVPKDQA